MGEKLDIVSARNEADFIRKKAQGLKEERVKSDEVAGEPTAEDYKNADRSLTQEIAELMREGSEEFNAVASDIEKKYKSRLAMTGNKEKLPKRLLVLECSAMDDLLGRLIVLSDERLDASNIELFDATTRSKELPENFDNISGIVISGSASDIVEKPDKPWIGEMEKFVEKALDKKIPVMGICFGIQVHADLKGREVPRNEGGRAMGVWETDIFLDKGEEQHPIFKGIDFQDEGGKKTASIKTVGSHAYHAEFNHKEQAESMHGFRFTEEGYYYPMIETDGSFVGVQFHPELSIPEGINLVRVTVKKRADKLIADGKDPKEILAKLDEYQANLKGDNNPDNVKFLRNFVDMVFPGKEKK